MKNLKYLISIVLILFCTYLKAQSTEISNYPTSLNIKIADSPLNGLVNAEFKFLYFSVSSGWRLYNLRQLPYENFPFKRVNSCDVTFTIYQNKYSNRSGFYLSLGRTTDSYKYKKNTGEFITLPSNVAIIGYKFALKDILQSEKENRESISIGIGCKNSTKGNLFAFEFSINHLLIK